VTADFHTQDEMHRSHLCIGVTGGLQTWRSISKISWNVYAFW